MPADPTYFCWHCYGQVDRPAGPCPHCGQEIQEPPGTDYTTRLLWALRHPLPDIRLVAAAVLGRRGDIRAVPALLILANSNDDPYLAATALEAAVAIQGVAASRSTLHHLRETGPIAVRRSTLRLLGSAEVHSDG